MSEKPETCDECEEVVRYFNNEDGVGLAFCSCCVEGGEALAGPATCFTCEKPLEFGDTNYHTGCFPMSDDSREWGDTVHTRVTIRLSWWGRLKVLLGAPLYVAVHVHTEFEVGATESSSEAWAHSWRLWRPGEKMTAHSPKDTKMNSPNEPGGESDMMNLVLRSNWRGWWRYILPKRLTLKSNPAIYRWLIWVIKP